MITGGQANALDLLSNSRDLRDLRRSNTGFQPYSFRYYDEESQI